MSHFGTTSHVEVAHWAKILVDTPILHHRFGGGNFHRNVNLSIDLYRYSQIPPFHQKIKSIQIFQKYLYYFFPIGEYKVGGGGGLVEFKACALVVYHPQAALDNMVVSNFVTKSPTVTILASFPCVISTVLHSPSF